MTCVPRHRHSVPISSRYAPKHKKVAVGILPSLDTLLACSARLRSSAWLFRLQEPILVEASFSKVLLCIPALHRRLPQEEQGAGTPTQRRRVRLTNTGVPAQPKLNRNSTETQPLLASLPHGYLVELC